MKFQKILALRGPNVWANFPVMEAWVELGEWKHSTSTSLAGFNERLMDWLPGLVEHRCSSGERGGFHQSLYEGTLFAHILQHVVLELQGLAGVAASYGRARETAEEGIYKVAFKYRDEALARACLESARELILAAAEDKPFDVAAVVKSLRGIAEDNLLGPSTNAIVQAARRRNIPFRRMNNYSLVQLGCGARQRRIRASETDMTGAIAEAIVQDKDLTRQLLKSAGVPAPSGYPVRDLADAIETVDMYLGWPVVVKPQDGNQGRGVTTNVTSNEQLEAAFKAALEESSSVMVEEFIPGDDYRLLVVNGKLVAASRREPAHVVGDGMHTVEELVEIKNQDPRRAEGHSNVLSKLHLDEIALNVLKDQRHTRASVPAAGERVLIRRNANLSTGGTATDVTDEVHPQVAARAVEAAKVVGLDVAGIDVIAHDIRKPLEEQGGAIVEVNAAPGLRMHLAPSEGKARDVGEAIVDMLFPNGENGRIPIAAVTGTNGKTTVTRFIAHLLRGKGGTVGMTCTDGIYLNDRRIDNGDCSGPVSAGMVLMNPNVDQAVFETARGGILRAGLGFNECQVAVVTNIADGDHLGLNDINTIEDLAKVKRTIVDVVAANGTAVLNATDPLVTAMAEFCPGRVMYFAIDGTSPVIRQHRAAGGSAIFVRDGMIVVADGRREIELLRVDRIPMTYGGRIGFEIENALASLGAAWAMGLDRETLAERAQGFSTDMNKVPGRFNVIELRGSTVIVDYGHNAHSLRAMMEALDAFPQHKRTAMYSMAGDRRDSDIIHIGELLGDGFDHVILYEAETIRGRKPGEIASLLREGLERGRRVSKIDEIDDPIQAMQYALDGVRPDDILLMQADTIDGTVDFVKQYLSRAAEARKTMPRPVFQLKARVYPKRNGNLSHTVTPRTETYACLGILADAPQGAKAW